MLNTIIREYNLVVYTAYDQPCDCKLTSIFSKAFAAAQDYQEADQAKEVTSLSRFCFFTYFGGNSLVTASDHAGYRSLSTSSHSSFFSRSVERFHHLNSHHDWTFNVLLNFAYAAVNDSNETYTLKEMLKQKDVANFVEAMIKEVNDHESRKHWICVPRSAIPQETETILAIRSFKRKRLPDGTIIKWKARLCCHGGMQRWGIN